MRDLHARREALLPMRFGTHKADAETLRAQWIASGDPHSEAL